VGILIKELNMPVVPVHIKGTYKAWPVGQALPKPAKVTITFGKPLSLKDLTEEKLKGDIYKNIVDTLRKEIIELA
jgi:1-acyl-sn-glycerol-3-phosphate acyltransferase